MMNIDSFPLQVAALVGILGAADAARGVEP
jgi:hypothetical protein